MEPSTMCDSESKQLCLRHRCLTKGWKTKWTDGGLVVWNRKPKELLRKHGMLMLDALKVFWHWMPDLWFVQWILMLRSYVEGWIHN
jgi:hypothetical protein